MRPQHGTKMPSYASLVELTAKISQAQEDTGKERKKQPRKEGRKEGRKEKEERKGKGKKEGRQKEKGIQKEEQEGNNEKGLAQELILLPLY